MLPAVHPIRLALTPASLGDSGGDLEGLHPTSIRFSRYPLRGIVLAASLAWRGDSVTGVDEIYTTPKKLSTPE